MGQSVLVFVSHSSEDKASLIEPIIGDLESCYINVWYDKRKILPGDNLRKSIFRDGLDKADVALIFFTENSLKSSWVDKEIKHVLREETKKGNNFDLSKIISIFDSKETYEEISDRYPELTDDLLHLMPEDYDKTQMGQLISAIWSKYLSLQGGDIETQRQLLAKDKEIFKKETEIQALKEKLKDAKSKNSNQSLHEEFEKIHESGKIENLIKNQDRLLSGGLIQKEDVPDCSFGVAFGLIADNPKFANRVIPTEKGKKFFQWYAFEKS
ncbi:hypothetical protein VDG1235_4073 [Verrucomicrobiia bacterium DG1235]|nr:hypothetical protein VDG1235_4073 [Verrucomicrobiae bacterium DG1235]